MNFTLDVISVSCSSLVRIQFILWSNTRPNLRGIWNNAVKEDFPVTSRLNLLRGTAQSEEFSAQFFSYCILF